MDIQQLTNSIIKKRNSLIGPVSRAGELFKALSENVHNLQRSVKSVSEESGQSRSEGCFHANSNLL